MAAYPVTDERYPPVYFRTYASVGSPQLLESTNAPANAQYLPCMLICVHGAGEAIQFTDIDGVANTITFDAAGVTQLRVAAKTIEAATCAVTVCWNQKG